MKKFLSIFLLLSMFAIPSAFCASSGGVSTGTQIWDGCKIFLWDTPVSTTASGAITLYNDSKNIQYIDANGAGRNVTLPAPGDGQQGRRFKIINAATGAYALTVKNAAASTIATVNQYQTGDFFWSGSVWVASVYTSATTGFLAADGSTTGATGQTQIFTSGVTTDAITGNTATTLAIAAKVGSSAAGNPITLTGGAGNGAFDGGAVTVAGGASGAGATGAGGALAFNGGAAGSTNGAGGAIAWTAGAGIGSGAGGAIAALSGAGGVTGAGGNYSATAGRGGSTSGAAGTAIITAGAGGAGTTVTGGLAALIGGASGTGATGNGSVAKIVGGAALSTAGTGGKGQVTGGLGTTTGAGGTADITGGVGGSSGSGGAANLLGGASAGAGGTAGAVAIDAGAATGGTGAGITIGTTNALNVTLGKTVWTPATVQDVAGAGGTITVPTLTSTLRVTATGSAGTATILAVGTIDGQVLSLVNVSANSITFATTATSHVADGASAIIAANTRMTLIWDNTSSKWYHGN